MTTATRAVSALASGLLILPALVQAQRVFKPEQIDPSPRYISGNFWYSRTCSIGIDPSQFVDWSMFDQYDDSVLNYWDLDPTALGSGGLSNDTVAQQEIAAVDYGFQSNVLSSGAFGCFTVRGPHGRHGAVFLRLPDADLDMDGGSGDWPSTVGTQPWKTAGTVLSMQFGHKYWAFDRGALDTKQFNMDVILKKDLAGATVSAMLTSKFSTLQTSPRSGVSSC